MRIRNVLIFAVCALPLAPAAFGAKKVKAGALVKQQFSDTAMGYSLTFPEEWKVSVKGNSEAYRVVAQQKGFDVPPKYTHAPDYTTIPQIKIWVDTTTLDVRAFLDSLKSTSFRSPQKDAMFEEFDLFDGDFARPTVSSLTLPGGVSARKLMTRLRYTLNVQRENASVADQITEFKQGDLIAVTRADRLYLFYFVCERIYYEALSGVFDGVMNSLVFAGAETEVLPIHAQDSAGSPTAPPDSAGKIE